MVKKDVKSKVEAKNGCDGVKKFNNDNSGEFGAKIKWHQIHLNCRY